MWRTFFKVVLAVNWVLLAAALVWFAVGMQRYLLSVDAIATPITLTPGQTAQVEVYRLREAPLWLEARFNESRGLHRPDVGQPPTTEPDHPKEPLRIRVQDGKGLDVQMTALPRVLFSHTHAYRQFLPSSQPDGTWLFPSIENGTSHLTFTVEQVDPTFLGEKIELQINPPIGLKRTAPGWNDVSNFIFWPIFAALLSIWGVIGLGLTWWYRRWGRNR